MTLVLRVHASMAAARPDWQEADLAGTAFQSFGWLAAWTATLGPAARTTPCIVVAEQDGRVVMLLPLGVAARRGLRTLVFLGGTVTDYNAPLVDPAVAATLDLADLWPRIRAALPPHDLVDFVRMPATLDGPGGAGEPAVPNPLARLAGAVETGYAQSMSLPPGGAEAMQKSLKSKFAADTKRRWRRLAEHGEVEFSVARDAAGTAAVIDALCRMKSRRWIETGGRDWFADASFRAFYEAAASMAPPASSSSGAAAHASLLAVGGTPIAVHWGLVWRDRFYHLMLGWEGGDWLRYATGRLITDALLREVAGQGIRAFDFTVGEEAYKLDWVDTRLPLFAYRRAATWRGHLALQARRARLAVRARLKQVRWLRAAVRRARGLPPIVQTET